MSKKMAGILIAYGMVLAGLGFLLQNLAPTVGRVTFIAGVGGGGLCVLWGVAALAGKKGRGWAILSAIAAAVVLLSQVVSAWMASASEVGGLTVRLLVTVMLLLTVGMLMYLLHGERPPEYYETGVNRRDNPFANQNAGQRSDGRSR